HHFLVERPAEAHGDGAIDLAAALHRVYGLADIRRVHALQRHDLARDAMNREANALNVEADRTRREIGLANDVEAIALGGALRVKLGEGKFPIAANDRVAF